MDFPIQSLIDEDQAEAWVLNHFHPQGLCCPQCQASVSEARNFRKTETSGLQVYRCKPCGRVYNLYSGTVFAGTQFRPSQVVLLLRGVCQGVSSAQLGRELGLTRQTILAIRRKLQSSAEQIQPEDALVDAEVETDEMFQNSGEKGERHLDASDPRVGVVINVVDTGLMKMIIRLLLGRKVVKVVCCDYVLCIRPMLRHFRHMCISLRCRMRRCIRMAGGGITAFSAPVRLFFIRMASGRETQMVMVFTKSIQIRLKVSGRRCATSCARFAVFIKSFSPGISQSVSSS